GVPAALAGDGGVLFRGAGERTGRLALAARQDPGLDRRQHGSPRDHRSLAMSAIDRTIRSFFLKELIAGMALTFRYIFREKVTLNYPYEKGPLSPRFRG